MYPPAPIYFKHSIKQIPRLYKYIIVVEMILETNENVSHSNVNSKSVVSSAETQLRENVCY